MQSECKKLLNNESVDVHMLYDFLARCRDEVTLEDIVGYIFHWEYQSSFVQVVMEQFSPFYLPLWMTLVVLGNTIGVDLFMNT